MLISSAVFPGENLWMRITKIGFENSAVILREQIEKGKGIFLCVGSLSSFFSRNGL
jgi:hypothetical protein